ncbi:MAG: hypothetical protein UY07_C0022G0005 [Parcubacteria group bacterium GW2011_GWA1_47_8]|nr:MAG: hypothetical protein UY07_C0022G0005 [Parcubacteria group bacterium GW2011_GWA1_47_8]KKW07862.1 MAG: hypothetical protein UY42_C0004G0004 [Parcubacteria group bacterium GW2011_GWA2_49_16]
MNTKTYDRQTAKFLGTTGENMPVLGKEQMQKWINAPRTLQKALDWMFTANPEVVEVVMAAISIGDCSERLGVFSDDGHDDEDNNTETPDWGKLRDLSRAIMVDLKKRRCFGEDPFAQIEQILSKERNQMLEANLNFVLENISGRLALRPLLEIYSVDSVRYEEEWAIFLPSGEALEKKNVSIPSISRDNLVEDLIVTKGVAFSDLLRELENDYLDTAYSYFEREYSITLSTQERDEDWRIKLHFNEGDECLLTLAFCLEREQVSEIIRRSRA